MQLIANNWSPRHLAIAAVVTAAVATALVGDWLSGASILLLALAFRTLGSAQGAPVLFFAFAFQWVQVTIGVFYTGLLGRPLTPHGDSDFRPMVLLGLVCLLLLLGGIAFGRWFGARGRPMPQGRQFTFSIENMVFCYIVSLVVAQGLQSVAWFYPQFTQAMIALGKGRYLFLFLLLRQLIVGRSQAGWFGLLLAGEVVFGLTSYFSSFKEPLFLAMLAMAERFNYRRAEHWLAAAGFGVIVAFFGLLWTGVKSEYRSEYHSATFDNSSTARFERVQELALEWIGSPLETKAETMDKLADRLWAVYYPALALKHVPAEEPHTDGQILLDTFWHIAKPRFFFPEKEGVLSDSEKVRQYAGIWVAGSESGTSIAFGYVGESYVDFGIPYMFAPIIIWGAIAGYFYEFFLRTIRRRELAIAFVTMAFWLVLYLFERSWTSTIGNAGMVFLIVGGGAILFDRLFPERRSVEKRRPARVVTGNPGVIAEESMSGADVRRLSRPGSDR